MPQVWGYRADGAAEIFELAEGEDLPAGWADTPAAFDGVQVAEAIEDEPVAAPKRRGRPPKVQTEDKAA